MTVAFRQETHNETAGVKQDYNRLGNQDLCTVRLSVRTPAFHAGKRSSILLRCTILRKIQMIFFRRPGVIHVDCFTHRADVFNFSKMFSLQYFLLHLSEKLPRTLICISLLNSPILITLLISFSFN